MSLDEFCQYFEDSCNGKDERLLNVISLEFSHTPMESLVEAPKVVCLMNHDVFLIKSCDCHVICR